MTIKDIYNLMDMCRRFKFESSDTSGKSPEEVRAYAEGYIRCKSCVMAVLKRNERQNGKSKRAYKGVNRRLRFFCTNI